MILSLADLVPIEITPTSIKFTRHAEINLFSYDAGADSERFPGRVEAIIAKELLCVWTEPDLV